MKQAAGSQQPIPPPGECLVVWGLQEGVPSGWLLGLTLGCPFLWVARPCRAARARSSGSLPTPSLQLAACQAWP